MIINFFLFSLNAKWNMCDIFIYFILYIFFFLVLINLDCIRDVFVCIRRASCARIEARFYRVTMVLRRKRRETRRRDRGRKKKRTRARCSLLFSRVALAGSMHVSRRIQLCTRCARTTNHHPADFYFFFFCCISLLTARFGFWFVYIRYLSRTYYFQFFFPFISRFFFLLYKLKWHFYCHGVDFFLVEVENIGFLWIFQYSIVEKMEKRNKHILLYMYDRCIWIKKFQL